MYVCICNGVTDRHIREAVASGCRSVAELTMRTGCGSNCGSCLDMAAAMLAAAGWQGRAEDGPLFEQPADGSVRDAGHFLAPKDADKVIGVVPAVMGLSWYDCVVKGMEAHAGPTPMGLRKDALQVATRLMQEVVACAHRHPPHGRGTVGMVHVHPNSRNVIPGRVKFSIDLRNSTDALVDAMVADAMAVLQSMMSSRNSAGGIMRIESFTDFSIQSMPSRA